MTALALAGLLVAVFAVAALANRRFGLRLEREPPPVSPADRCWLDELAVLELERRHPIC